MRLLAARMLTALTALTALLAATLTTLTALALTSTWLVRCDAATGWTGETARISPLASGGTSLV
jgi:hypothetical protein